jgi:hypothetical protein
MRHRLLRLDNRQVWHISAYYETKLDFYLARIGYDEDGCLWIKSDEGIYRLDGQSRCVHRHFAQLPVAVIHVEGREGLLGTLDGELFRFDTRTQKPTLVTRLPGKSEVQAISFDPAARQIYCATDRRIFSVSYDGELTQAWNCQVPPFDILFCRHARKLWSVSSGIEIFDCESGESAIAGAAPPSGYVQASRAPGGSVACFGGDIDIFDSSGQATVTIEGVEGGFNGGRFVSDRHLCAMVIGQASPQEMRITRAVAGEFTIDYLVDGDDIAVSPARNKIAAMQDGRILFFKVD